MEMDNQIIQQMLNVQTQMLQHITTLQQQQALNNSNLLQINNQNAPDVDGNSVQVSSPTAPPPIAPISNPAPYSDGQDGTGSYAAPAVQMASPVVTPTMPVDPTAYSSYAENPYPVDGGRPVNSTQFDPRNLIASSIAEANTFNPAGQSLEASSNYMYQQNQGVQMGVVNAIGGALKGGVGIGSWFLPGLVPSLVGGAAASMVVGGAANAMVGGARDALDYQSILQEKGPQFISAFHSSNELGGIGWGLSDQQEASRFLRELAPQEFMNNSDMQKILSGAADNGLMKNVTDVKDFQKKFKDIVGAVKDITVTMNQTIDEATQFMGQMQQMGIMTKDMPLTAAQIKTMSSTLGVSSAQGAQIALGGGQQLAQGTGMNASGAVQNVAESTYYAQDLWNNAPDGSAIKNLINNNGGAAQVGANFPQYLSSFINSQQGEQLVSGLFGSAANIDSNGNISVDQSKLKDILSGNQSATQLTQESVRNISNLNPGQQVEMVGKLSEELTNMSANDSSTLPEIAKRVAESYQQQAALSGTKMDMQTALVQSGISPDYNSAQMMEAMINQATDPQLKAQFDARSMKAAQDSHIISNSPNLFARAKFWAEQNIGAPLGGVGQNVSDAVGQAGLSYQKWLTGMNDRSTVNAQSLQDFSEKGLQQEFGQLKSVDTVSNNMYNYLTQRNNAGDDPMNTGKRFNDALAIQGNEEKTSDIVNQLKGGNNPNQNQIGSDMYSMYIDQASKGQMDPATLARLSNMKNLGLMDTVRRSMIESQATGQYDGVGGKVNYALDETGYALLSAGNWVAKRLGSGDMSTSFANASKSSTDTYKSLQTQQKELEDEKKKLNQDTAALFTSSDIRGMSQSDLTSLQDAITSGDVNKVQSLTGNKQAADLANRAKSLSGLDDQYTKAMGDYTNASQYTQALANSGNLMAGTFSSAGIDEATIHDLLGGVQSQGKKMSSDLKNHKLSTADMASNDKQLLQKYDASFAGMTEYTKEQLAQYLENTNKSFNLKDVLSSDGKSVDSSKLEQYMLKSIKNENVSQTKNNAKNQTASASDVNKGLQDHSQAMYNMLTTLQQETQMMNDVSNNVPVTNNNNSSLGTRG